MPLLHPSFSETLARFQVPDKTLLKKVGLLNSISRKVGKLVIMLEMVKIYLIKTKPPPVFRKGFWEF